MNNLAKSSSLISPTDQSKLFKQVAVGLFFGLLLSFMFRNAGWLLVIILLAGLILFLIGLNTYRAWLLLLIASTLGETKFGLGGLTIHPEQLAMMILVLGWIPALLIGRAKLNRVPLLLPVTLYIAVNFISTNLYAVDKSDSYRWAFELGIYAMMYVMSVMVLRDHPKKLKSAVKIMLALGIFQCIYALIAFTAHHAGINLLGVAENQIQGKTSLQGGFEEPNFLGAFEAAIGIILLALMTAGKTQIKKSVSLLSLVLVLIVVAMTYTRASWIGFGVGLLFLIFLQKPSRNIFNPRAAAASIALLTTVFVIAIPFTNTLTSGGISQRVNDILNFGTESTVGRINVEKIALDRWENAVMLGNGTLSFPKNLAISESSQAGSWLYSSVIQSLHDTGIVGLGFLLWFNAGVIVIVLRGYRRTKDPFYRASLAGFAVASVVIFIASQASSFLWLGFPWIFSGLAVVVAEVAAQES